MKKLAFLSIVLFLCLPAFYKAQDNQNKKTEYCILRVYNGTFQGVHVIYDDLKVEKHALLGIKTDEVLQTIMVYVNEIKLKGFTIISSSTTGTDYQTLSEYVFKKE